jgi:PAS domain S-box-containing protein
MLDQQCSLYQGSSGGVNVQLFQSSADCIKVLDAHGRVVDLNPGGVQALQLDDPLFLHGKLWVEFWPDETRPIVLGAIAAALGGGRGQFGAFCPTAKGEARWWDVVVTPIHDDQGQVSQLMVVSRDVTDIYLARSALQASDQRKDEFLALLAHELRNPLSAAGMAATLLQTQALSADRVAEIGKLIARQVAHMSRLAEDLLDVSRLTRGDISVNMLPVDMGEVVRVAVEQVQARCAEKRQQVAVTAGDAPCVVLGDKTRLIQIVGNLLANAVRYTPEQGSIALHLTRSGAEVALAVSDTGVGIPPDQIATLFDLYTRVDRADASASAGLGIGLALVRRLVELHGGSVTAFSAGTGRGSTFTIALPAAPGPA